VWLADGRLDRLTTDRYQDLDPSISPDGRTVVFASDRRRSGPRAPNLFLLDLATGAVRHLTYGDWRDETPRWSAATGRIWFASDSRQHAADLLGGLDRHGPTGNRDAERRLRPAVRGWRRRVRVRRLRQSELQSVLRPRHEGLAAPTITLAEVPASSAWEWPELNAPAVANTTPKPYKRRYGLDFAAGEAAVAPGLGSQQGAVMLFSDLLNDHQFIATLSSFSYSGSGLGNLLDNLSGSAFYLNQTHRINWGVGPTGCAACFTKVTSRVCSMRPPTGCWVRYATRSHAFGGSRRSSGWSIPIGSISRARWCPSCGRVAWLAANYLTYVKDNSLWFATGPIDGERYSVTAGL
jgi:hypothetical protein